VNAIAHRHYRLPAQPTVVHATPESFTVRLPGDFVPGVTPPPDHRPLGEPKPGSRPCTAHPWACRARGPGHRHQVRAHAPCRASRPGDHPGWRCRRRHRLRRQDRSWAVQYFDLLSRSDPGMDGVRTAVAETALLTSPLCATPTSPTWRSARSSWLVSCWPVAGRHPPAVGLGVGFGPRRAREAIAATTQRRGPHLKMARDICGHGHDGAASGSTLPGATCRPNMATPGGATPGIAVYGWAHALRAERAQRGASSSAVR